MRHSKKFEFEILEYETRIQTARERWRKVPRLRHILNGLQRYSLYRTSTVAEDIEILLTLQAPNSNANKRQTVRKPFVIYPNDKWKIAFDIIVAILIVYYCWRVPYKIGFNDRIILLHEDVFEGIIGLDIIFHFFSAYLDNNSVIDDIKQISKNYLKGFFMFDIIAILPLHLIDFNFIWLKLARLARLYYIFDKLENYVIST